MKKKMILFSTFILLLIYPSQVFASNLENDAARELLNQAELVASIANPDEQDKEVIKLQKMLENYDVDISKSYWTPEENEALTRGYGQWHDLGKGYKVRVDRPHGSNDTKPHVHVKKGNKDVTENVDGSNSHGTNMTRGGVPKDIQKKVKGLNDYKKAQKDLKSMNAARSKIKARKLNMKKTADIIIAIGIFIAVVGFAIFAASAIASWGAFFLVFI